MGYPVKEVYDLSDIGLLKVDQNNEKTQKKGPSSPRVNPDARQDKGETQLGQAVKKAKENGRVHYIHRSEKAMQSVLEGKEFVASWSRGVSLACVKQSEGGICSVSDGQDLFPVLTEKNEPLSESMKSFVAQIKPDRYIPIRFGMSHTGNKEATRDTDFCDLIEGCSTDATPQTYNGNEYHDGLTVGFDSQMNPLVYSSFDGKIHIVKDTVLGENIYGDFVLLDYSGEDNVVSVLRHTPETYAYREKQIHAAVGKENQTLTVQDVAPVLDPVEKNIVPQEVKEEDVIKHSEVIPQNEEIQSTESVDEEFLGAIEGLGTAAGTNYIGINEGVTEEVIAAVVKDISGGKENLSNINTPKTRQLNKSGTPKDYHQNKHLPYSKNEIEKKFNETFPFQPKLTTLKNQSQSIVEELLSHHPKLTKYGKQYHLDKTVISYMGKRNKLHEADAIPGTNVRSKNGVAGVIVKNIDPETNKPIKVHGQVKVNYFRKDSSSGKERSVACMTKIENLYAAKPAKKPTPSSQPTNHMDMKGQ